MLTFVTNYETLVGKANAILAWQKTHDASPVKSQSKLAPAVCW